MADILLMEPDTLKSRMMRRALSRAGFTCRAAATVQEGDELLRAGAYSATVLNAQMPWKDSFSFLRALEAKGLPVLFLTTDPANAEHLRALYASSCDVLLIPCPADALVAALQRLLCASQRQLSFGPLRMDLDTRQVAFAGMPISLTAQEFALLHALMQSPDTAVTREELLRTAWGYESMGLTRTVDVHIQRLRRKLGASFIETVYKTGYRLRLA